MPNAFTDVSNLKIENPYNFDFDGKRNVNVFAYVLCRCYDVILKSEWCKNEKKKEEKPESRKNGHESKAVCQMYFRKPFSHDRLRNR